MIFKKYSLLTHLMELFSNNLIKIISEYNREIPIIYTLSDESYKRSLVHFTRFEMDNKSDVFSKLVKIGTSINNDNDDVIILSEDHILEYLKNYYKIDVYIDYLRFSSLFDKLQIEVNCLIEFGVDQSWTRNHIFIIQKLEIKIV